jgi:hypothetical protein
MESQSDTFINRTRIAEFGAMAQQSSELHLQLTAA